MKRVHSAMVLGSLLASVHCTDANAPVSADPPTISSPSARIAFVTELPDARGGFVFVANADGSGAVGASRRGQPRRCTRWGPCAGRSDV